MLSTKRTYSIVVPISNKNVRKAVRILNKRLIGNKAIFSIHLIGCRSFLLNHFEVSQSIHDSFLFFRCALWNNLFLFFLIYYNSLSSIPHFFYFVQLQCRNFKSKFLQYILFNLLISSLTLSIR